MIPLRVRQVSLDEDELEDELEVDFEGPGVMPQTLVNNCSWSSRSPYKGQRWYRFTRMFRTHEWVDEC